MLYCVLVGLKEALNFNQDISSWCVEQISTEPFEFSLSSPLQNDFKPNWGATCNLSDTGFNFTTLSVYPNPVRSGMLYISGLDYGDSTNVEIVSILGKTVMSKTYKDSTKDLSINVQDLDSGVYFIKLSQGSGTHTTKVIIQ